MHSQDKSSNASNAPAVFEPFYNNPVRTRYVLRYLEADRRAVRTQRLARMIYGGALVVAALHGAMDANNDRNAGRSSLVEYAEDLALVNGLAFLKLSTNADRLKALKDATAGLDQVISRVEQHGATDTEYVDPYIQELRFAESSTH